MRKLLIVILGLICLSAIMAYGLKKMGYGLTYQPTASMPRGFYWIFPPRDLKKNDIVLFRPPWRFRKFLLSHHFIPDSGILMKYVAGVPGDEVCNQQGVLTINHRTLAPLYQFYEGIKPLPRKAFCQRLKDNQYLLISLKENHSFDGRYMGSTNKNDILGKCRKMINE